MSDLYLVEFGNDDEHARYPAECVAERARVRQTYVDRLIARGGLEAATAERAVAVIFDHVHEDGSPCPCGCHPQLFSLHGDGMDCPCTWDQQRREAERRTWLAGFRDSEWAKALREEHEAEERKIRAWLSGQVGVIADRTSSSAPEQWEGNVDGHSFYFRERHGEWQIELDLQPSGRFAQRFAGVDDDGRPMTEPVELTEGEAIAGGLADALGSTPVWSTSTSSSGPSASTCGCGPVCTAARCSIAPMRRADVTTAGAPGRRGRRPRVRRCASAGTGGGHAAFAHASSPAGRPVVLSAVDVGTVRAADDARGPGRRGRSGEGAAPCHSGATLIHVPTTRPRIMVTETDELAAALNSAASRYPGLTRAQLLTRLALEGEQIAQRAQEDRRRHRLAALREHSGSLTGAYGEHYLEQLRQEWPA